MKVRILSVIMVALMAFCSISCTFKENGSLTGAGSSGSESNQTQTTESNQLQIIKSDIKLSKEDMVSRIKAEYLLENGGYSDNDEIVVMINLPGDALIDRYLNEYAYAYKSVAEFAVSAVGKNIVKNIKAKQQVLVNELKGKGLIDEVENTYYTLLNAVSATVKYGNLKAIESLTSVSSTIIADTYNLPKTTEGTDVSAIENAVDIYPTGIFKPTGVDYTGNNTSVAVLDSGFDCSHSVFANQPSDPMFTERDVLGFLDSTKAAEFTKDLELGDVYYSRKIPFAYDYADKDADVFPYDSEHGTHVAGIIGGKDEEITGIAKDTQLVLMKVFPDLDTGATTDDILLALEDAVLIGVDAINMSLGSACGFTREEDGNKINVVYDKINEAGISLVTAASNDYNSAYGGAEGNTNKVTNPDSATVGSPSTYMASLSVASISGTKSRYLIANDEQVVFFNESNSINGKENNFFEELYAKLGLSTDEVRTIEYVTVPGNGLKVNYSSIDVKGKVALVRRGDNTFEEKAQLAKNAGAIACIIYNNVEGDILMSMGKSDHIPTISISKEDGTKLAKKKSGTFVFDNKNQAGPFMSDFSSWGPTPDLKLKPEITAHGGNIRSAVPGGGYDIQSGTSMASPNMCGAIVLLRQHLKEKYPDASHKEISVMANQLLMSTATIVLNKEGNPYSPRKQGAGLASLKGAVTTDAYITVDGIDRAKLELGDDKQRTGVYTMEFNVINISENSVEYKLSTVAMTESVSTSDKDFVAEKAYLLSGNNKYEVVSGGSLNGNTVTVEAGKTAKIKLTYTLSKEDKDYITNSFPYGSYVEGFVKLTSTSENGVNLNAPFLAFFGDWTEAPMFDKTYYEVESEAHNGAIDEEDKLKADYYATTPYGSYYYNYIIPLGGYLYDIDTNAYDAIPATEEHIAMSNILGTIDGLSCVYAGLLRNAKEMEYTITDKVTGEVVWSDIDYNAQKAHYYGGIQFPYYDNLRLSNYRLGLVNNRQYEFKMTGILDYGDGGVTSNVRNTFSFDFFMDDQAPVLREVTYDKEYDRTLKKDRYYINMTVYDNHYAMSVQPILFTSSSSYTFLTDNPIPIYSEKNSDTTLRFEITDYLEDVGFDAIMQSGLAFAIDDYALNSNLYICQLPGTKGDFKFTKDGNPDSTALDILTVYEDEVIDLTKYLSTKDGTVDENKDYLKYLVWESSNESVATVKEGLLKCHKAGQITVKVTEQMELKAASLIVRIKARNDSYSEKDHVVDNGADATIKKIRFSHFETLFAYSRAAQYSYIGSTGDTKFLSALNGISFYPGEKIKLYYDLDPWYAEDNYELSFHSRNPQVASVNEKGEVTALKKGSTIIELRVAGSNLMATVNVTVNSEFIIENRQLIAYKGLGGEVVIPDDEGILYISAYAFCLYETDQTMELPEDDYDANKIPSMNTTITKVVIPEGVEDIQKYAFYNCIGLKEVVIPESVKYIREYAFYKTALENVDVKNALVLGHHCFAGCENLKSITMPKIYAIGARAFEGCKLLNNVDLTSLRNTGKEAFKDCTSLANVTFGEHTKLSYAMFAQSGIKQVDIYEKEQIPEYCFAKCEQLEKVTFHNDIVTIGLGAFSECLALSEVNFKGVEVIGEQAFYGSTGLESIKLPDSEVVLGGYAFLDCYSLSKVIFGESTLIKGIEGSVFEGTALNTFEVDANNKSYGVSQDGKLLENKVGDTVILAVLTLSGDYVIDAKYSVIGDGAFAGTLITSVTITNNQTVIGDHAFAFAENLKTVTLPSESGVVIESYAFRTTTALENVINLDKVMKVGDYAFAYSGAKEYVTGANSVYGDGVFYSSEIEEITLGENSVYGIGSFRESKKLTTVNMPENGGVHFKARAFAGCTSLSTIDLTKVDAIIEEETFYGCTALKVANLANVTHIGAYAFSDCATLLSLTVPKVVEIGEGAFSRNADEGSAPIFTAVELPNTLTVLGEASFLYCQGLLEITIPEGIEEIGDFAFAFCVNLAKVTLPESVKEIGEYAFAGCEVLTNINTGNVEVFKDYAFGQAKVLENIDLTNAKEIGEGAFMATWVEGNLVAENLVKVGAYAFQNTFIESLTAPNLAHIGEGAFYGNKQMKKFTLSSQIAEVQSMAFINCTALETFNYSDNGSLKTEGEINGYAKLVNGALYTKMPSGGWLLSSIPANLNVETFEVANGTTRIEFYAGNENKNIQKVVLPDGLKLIGNYAFYACDNLKTVEFNSVTAPALEANYDSSLVLDAAAPGFGILHEHFDLFGFELYYCNFVYFLGSKEPIKMILPANEDIQGYDSLVYQAYFGKVSESQRSEYVAMEVNLINFIEYATKISEISNITLSHEALINKALTAYVGITQKATDYGVSEEDWNKMVTSVNEAKKTLTEIKLAKAIQQVRDVQSAINALDTTFSVSDIPALKEVAAKINALTPENREILDLTVYNELMAKYNAYLEDLNEEVKPLIDATANVTFAKVAVAVASLSALAGVATLLAFVIKRKIG